MNPERFLSVHEIGPSRALRRRHCVGGGGAPINFGRRSNKIGDGGVTRSGVGGPKFCSRNPEKILSSLKNCLMTSF